MSVLIKGMEMPKDCKVCPFCDYEQGLCLANNYMDTAPRVIGKRHDDCPLIEVPTPHGRLVEFIDIETEEADGTTIIHFSDLYEAYMTMKCLPPIIESEVEE